MSAPVHPAVTLLLTAMALALGGCATMTTPAPATSPMTASPPANTTPLAYPAATRGSVTDTYGTTVVADPYRWMEDPASPELRAWITAENRLSGEFLARVPGRERLTTRLTALWNYERYGAALQGAREFELPFRRGGRYFYLRNDGLQNQSVLYVTDSLEAPPRVLLDPNALSQDATVALADYEISPDGRVLAYATSDGGTDWKTWHFREVATARDLADELRQTKFTSVSWTPDSRAVYYSRYPVDTAGHGDDSRQVVVFRHALGTPQATDARVYAVENHATRDPYAEITDDGRYLLVRLDEGFETNGFDYLDLKHPGAGFRPLFDRWDGLYGFLGNRGSELFFTTTQGAPRGRVIAIDVDARPATVRTVVPESASALTAASLVGGVLIAQYLEDAHSVVKRFALDGETRGTLTLPGSGTVTGFYGPEDSAETFYAYTDYVTPRSIYRYDVATDTSTLFRRPRLAIDLDRYVSRQVFYTSKDGTRVPMSIVSRRDLVLDGRQPTLLYGYGGFSVPLTPGFSVPIAVWLEMGGVYAVANLRGGSEYGEDWHLAGTRLRKQNVFDDFIAAAEWLIAQGYTSPDRLAIQGRSNGGLLVGAVMLQRPALFGAALPGVGVLDMLRYHTASANARQWSSDYGLSEDPAEFAALRAYSPVHNVREGACYPPTLITTADHDDRVVPWHSFKFAAALQHAQGCDKPVLIRVETRAGHGGGKPTWMQIEDWVDQWSFLIATLHLQPTLP